MTPSRSQLVQLLRLHDSCLAPAQSQALRGQLNQDPSLRSQWHAIMQATAQSNQDVCLPESETWDWKQMEQLASLVDDFLGEEAIRSMETDLMNSPNDLRELASLDRWIRLQPKERPSPPSSTRQAMKAVLDREVPEVVQLAETSHVRKRPTAPRLRQRGRTRPQSAVSKRLFMGTIAAAVMLGLLVVTWFHRSDDQGHQMSSSSGESSPQRQASSQHDNEATPYQQPVQRPYGSRQSLSLSSPPKKENSDSAPGSTANVPDSIEPIPPQAPSPQVVPLRWTSVVGLVAVFDDQQNRWQAVSAETTSLSTPQSDRGAVPLRFRSLPESWAQASTDHGLQIVLDESTQATIQFLTGSAVDIRLVLEQGQIALGNIPKGTIVHLQTPNDQQVITSASDETTLLFSTRIKNARFAIVQGEIAHGDSLLSGPCFVQVLRDGRWQAGRLRTSTTWITQPPKSNPLADSLLSRLKNPTNVVQSLLTDGTKTPDAETDLAIRWSFMLDPLSAVPLAANSPNAQMRKASIAWLESSTQDPQQQAAVWRAMQPMLARSNRAVSQWFQAAHGNIRADRKRLLTDLGHGIGAQEPLFVREAAIHYLRKYTRQRFATYDPANPTPRAIREVRAVIRKLLDSNPAGTRQNVRRRNR